MTRTLKQQAETTPSNVLRRPPNTKRAQQARGLPPPSSGQASVNEQKMSQTLVYSLHEISFPKGFPQGRNRYRCYTRRGVGF